MITSLSSEKRADSILDITLTNSNKQLYFCKEYREECETTNTTKVRLT